MVGEIGSFIESISATNLAGIVDDETEDTIELNLGGDAGLVAVTGETGSGKSLLVAKLVSIVTGGKASPSLIPSGKDDANDKTTARVDMGECIRCMRLSSALVFLPPIDEQTANPYGNLTVSPSISLCLFLFLGRVRIGSDTTVW